MLRLVEPSPIQKVIDSLGAALNLIESEFMYPGVKYQDVLPEVLLAEEDLPLTIEQHLNACYKADVLRSTGKDYPAVVAEFAAALAEDSVMKDAARAKLDALLPVDKKRQGKDYGTAKQVKYLTEAIGA